MYRLVMANDTRLDRVEKVADVNADAIQQIATTGDRRSNRNLALWTAVVASVGSNLAVLIDLFSHHAH